MNVVKSVKVTFADGLPAGRRGTFTYDKEVWVALPLSKHKRMTGCIDRLIGLQNRMVEDMVRWINRRPQDAEFCVSVMDRVNKLRTAHRELVTEKVKAGTS